MPATSSEDVRGILRSFSAALDEPQKGKLDSYLPHLGHVGDETGIYPRVVGRDLACGERLPPPGQRRLRF